ncbi:MAG: SMP-30/gluconolactonase/LRE family protein [Sedimentisphaerales bacterium]|nr:SMP-30/gluconolactonase/LRE family protein [Sedimentisphaerales bacterium]
MEGPNQVEIRCTDGANNVAEPLVLTDITLDTTKPQLFSLIPRSKEAVATKTFTVSGQSTEALKGITVNSQAVPLGLDKKSFLGVYKVTATGPTTLTWIAEDLATNKTTTQIVVSVSDQPEVPSIVSIPICGGAVDTDYRYQVVAIHPNPLETLTFSLPVAPSGAAIHPQTGLLTWRPSTSQTGPQNITVRVTDTAQKYAEQAFQVDVVKLPPDPVKTAPPLSTSSATPVSLASAFLYTDKNDPIQHLEDPKVIDVVKAGVVRGRVTTSDGSPLPGVKIAVNGHPEYGWTLSRADGIFDIAVNGDRTLTINFEHPGFIPAQRPAYVSAQDYGMVADVAMIRYDPIVTPIDVTPSAPLQVARSSLITDSDGTRRATLLFKPGTTALLQIGKDALPLSTLSVRATEFSVGPSGSERMPAPLPAQVGYTYCVGLSADEARTQDCGPILLSQPAFMYLENFLNFPVGEGVPAGRYDYEKGAWEPSDDGLVLKVLSITAEMADIDIDGSNTPATPTQLAAIGIEDAERKELAQLYPIGQTLWRVAVPQIMSCHLLTEEAPPAAWDYNFPWGPRDPDAIPPNGGNPRNPPLPPPPCDVDTSACTIKNFTQVLLERVPIVGTPFTLNYSSERVPGYARRRTLRIPLSADKIPASLSAIELAVSVAGTRFTKRFPPAANLSYTYTWDGNDVYGRPVLGTRHATVDVGFVYPAAYQRKVPHWKRNFMTLSGSPFPANPGRREITIWKRSTETLHAGGYASAFALSGWSLDTHHSYEPGYSLTLGTGNSRDAYSPLDLVASVFGQTFAGSRFWMGADGFLYTMGNDNSGSLTPWRTCILRIAPDGKAETIFLSIRTSQFGSGATDKDGNIYICYGGWVSGTPLTVAHVDPTTGVVTRLAGDPNNFEGGFSGDDGPALAARINYPTAIALDPDGSILFVDSANFRIRKITPDGYIHTVAGNGSTNVTGDGGPAINAGLGRPEGLAIDNEGNIYVTCGIPLAGRVIRRISPDGIIRRIAGNGGNGLEKEGLPALSSPLNANSVQLDPSGTLFFGSGTVMPVVHRLSPEGLLHRVAGDGVSRTAGIGGLARAASFPDTREFAVGPTAIFIRDHVNDRVFKVASSIPEFNWDDTVIPSADGRELFCFDRHGKHFRTVDAFLASIRYAFQYTPEGLLADCTDGDGNVTKIVRDASGNPIEIVGPYGHVTKLETDANGYLSTIEDPNGERRAFSYTADGLLVTMSDPAGNRYTFEYDELGRLTREDDPAGGCQILNRQEGEKECTITRRTAVGRATVHKWEESTAGTATTAVTSPDGTKTLRSFPADGNFTATFSDGTKYDMLLRPDPRFGMNSGVLGRRNIVLPSTLTLAQGTTRSATLAIAKDPLSVVTATSNTIVNGRSYSTTFDKPSLTYVNRSPEARISTSTVDAKGRVTKWEVPLLDPVYLTYDARGRLATLQTGPATSLRNTVFSYDVAGNLSSLRDPASRLWQYSHDLNGRLTTLIFPSAEKVLYQYDKNGNVVSITPPGRPAHGFTYTALGQIKEYIPPSVGSGTWTTTYRYNRDRQLEEIERPDAQKAIYQYDPVTGKLTARILPNGTTTYSYDANTGNLVTIANPAVTLSFEYDGFLRTKTTWAGAINGSVSHQYDTDFAIVSESVNGGHTVTFEYDKDKLLTRAGSMTLAYDSQNGLLTCTQLGAVHDLYAYNSSGEVVAYTAWHSTSTLYSYQLSRDNLGRITAKTEYVAGSTTQYTYTYDLDGRLVTVNRGAVTAKYAYDANGNRTSYESGTTLLTGTYDAQDRLLTYGTKQFEYTRSGELLKITDGTNVTSLDYCILGNLMKVVLPGGKTVEYVIDGRGRRVGKKVDGKLVKGWLYKDGLNLVAEVDENGAIVSRFVYGRYRHVPDLMVATKSTYRLLCDHLGSPRLVVDTATSPVSTIAQSVDYDEYGIVFRNTAPEFQPFGFCGGLWEDETGLGRFGWRDYMAVIGRWTARDPILFGGGSPNIYIYVGNSPTNCVDPAGAKILVCNRRAGFPIGLVGNHAFLWDTVNEEGCGMSGSSGGNQSGPTCGDEPPPDPEMCAEVEGSEGKEKDIMDWMRENANTGPWIPWYNDCHKKAQEAIEGQGLGYPGAPGGRFPPL